MSTTTKTQAIERDQEVVDLASQLINIDSRNPGSSEEQVERFIRRWAQACCGFTLPGNRVGAPSVEHVSLPLVQEVEALPNRLCLRMTIPTSTQLQAVFAGEKNHPSDLTLICHMDTVTDGEGWNAATPALQATLVGDRLYGRGSCDMKGGMACALLAFRDFCRKVAERGQLPHRSLSVICTVDEEANMRGVEAAIDAGWVGHDGWVLDAEPTGGKIRGSHKGRTWFRLRIDGVTAHASTPWEGADAIAAMAFAITSIRTQVDNLPTHPELGPSTVTFGQVNGGYQPYVVPDCCEAWIDMRLVPPSDAALAEKIVRAALVEAEAKVPGAHGSFEVTGNRAPVELAPQSPLLHALCDAIEACGAAPRGGMPEIDVFTGYTDTAVIATTCKNGNCMSYGPGELELAHKPNEYVPVADLARVRRVFDQLCAGMLDS